jgi:pimeloyl-ACP methyl ester carboxylesterase
MLKLIPSSFKKSLPTSIRAKLLRLSGSATDYLYSSPIQKQILVKVIHEDIRPLLPAIDLPTLLIWGEKDSDTPLAHAHQFKRLIPGSELSTFADVGHFPFIEQPARFVREITSFYQA